jgi:hypothetical protein
LTLSCDSTAARNWAAISPSSRHIALQQPVAVFGEGRGIPYRVLDAEPDKPAKQQVVVDPLDQLPLRADRIERLQQQCAHQPLGAVAMCVGICWRGLRWDEGTGLGSQVNRLFSKVLV